MSSTARGTVAGEPPASGRRPPDLGGALDQSVVQERRKALRALLRRPLLTVDADDFPLVRRHLEWLRDWLSRHAGWRLHFDGEIARLYKTPPLPDDPTRPARDPKTGQEFSRRRYVFWCLAVLALERADRQTALGRLAQEIVGHAKGSTDLARGGFTIDLERRDQRRDLVHVVRLLLDLGVLRRVEGHEDAYVSGRGDVLYDIRRGALASLLATRHGPSLVSAGDATARRAAIVEEPAADSPEGRNRRIRHRLTRLLLDHPIVEIDALDDDERDYLQSQRHALVSRIEEATGLVPEVRAEGLAMVDDRGDCTDLALPEEGTDGHVALLLAEHLADLAARSPGEPVSLAALESETADFTVRHGRWWRKDARAPGAEIELTRRTLDRLEALSLVDRTPDGIVPRAAIARFAMVPDDPDEESS